MKMSKLLKGILAGTMFISFATVGMAAEVKKTPVDVKNEVKAAVETKKEDVKAATNVVKEEAKSAVETKKEDVNVATEAVKEEAKAAVETKKEDVNAATDVVKDEVKAAQEVIVETLTGTIEKDAAGDALTLKTEKESYTLMTNIANALVDMVGKKVEVKGTLKDNALTVTEIKEVK